MEITRSGLQQDAFLSTSVRRQWSTLHYPTDNLYTHARTHTHTHPMQTLHPDDIQTGPRQPCASQSHHVASNWCVLQTVLSPPTNNISDVLCKPQITALRMKLIPTVSRTALRGPRQLFQSHTQLRADARKNNTDPTRLSTQSLLVCSAC